MLSAKGARLRRGSPSSRRKGNASVPGARSRRRRTLITISDNRRPSLRTQVPDRSLRFPHDRTSMAPLASEGLCCLQRSCLQYRRLVNMRLKKRKQSMGMGIITIHPKTNGPRVDQGRSCLIRSHYRVHVQLLCTVPQLEEQGG